MLTLPSCAHGGMQQASPAPATYFMLCDAHGSQTARCSLGSCELGMKESERAGAVLALSIFHEVKKK